MRNSRWNEKDLEITLTKKGVGVQSSIGKGIKSSIKGTLNPKAGDTGKMPNLEQHFGRKSLGEKAATLRYSGQVVVRTQVFRRRLADPDGNSLKYFLDGARYAGLLEDDTERHIRIITEPQQKVETNEEERVELTLEYQEIDPDNLYNQLQ